MSKIPFDNVDFFQVDERYVPKDHEDSNYKMIMETLNKEIHHFDTSLSIPESLKKYKKELPEQFDLIILGIGMMDILLPYFQTQKLLIQKKK